MDSLSLSLFLYRDVERKREKNLPRAPEEVSLSRLNGLRWMQAEIRVGCLSLSLSLRQVPLLSLLLIEARVLCRPALSVHGHCAPSWLPCRVFSHLQRCNSMRLLRGRFVCSAGHSTPSRAEPSHAAPSCIISLSDSNSGVKQTLTACIERIVPRDAIQSLSLSSTNPIDFRYRSGDRYPPRVCCLVLSGYGPIPRPRRAREAGDH